MPDALLESELFGHVRGSFTGAYRDKPGLFETVPNGTVFLDEVAEMSARMQAVLLRFLEGGEVQRLGADRPHSRVHPRIIAATNRDLSTQISTGAFREDLYFRLNVVRVDVPPLRERRDDIPALVDHFLTYFGRLHRIGVPSMSPDAMDALCKHAWPGNVRELKNVVERVLLRSDGAHISASGLPDDLRPAEVAPRPAPAVTPTPGDSATVNELLTLMIDRGRSFWATVYPAFMSRDLTRADLRRIVRTGLESTRGNYRLLVDRFNMPMDDYNRFLAFLRQYDCHLSFQFFGPGGQPH
jgi:DNA-binding NtrC family response regulator